MGDGRVPGPLGSGQSKGQGVKSVAPLGIDGRSAPHWDQISTAERDHFEWWVQDFSLSDLAASAARVTLPGRTSVANVLAAFFYPGDVGLGIWVMREADSYTEIIRRWRHVKPLVAQLRQDVIARPEAWKLSHATDRKWKPSPNAIMSPRAGFRQLVRSPAGTDPMTCKQHLKYFLATGIATETLHTAAIGSFTFFATADLVDPSARLAELDVWTYNKMSSESFGKFARMWPFNELPMPPQHMWWNWKEKFNYDATGNVEPWRGYLKF